MACLVKHYGRRCHGIDLRPVNAHRETKSVSVETTFEKDLYNEADCNQQLGPLINKLYHRLSKYEETYSVNSCRVKVTFYDFSKTSAEQAVSGWSPGIFNQLLSKALGRYAKKGVRLIGVGVGISPASGQIALPL